MKYFNKTFPKEILKKLHEELKNREEENPYDQRNFLVSNSPGSKYKREEFDKILELAYHHNIIDAHLIKSLHSKKEKDFYQIYQELAVAYFFEKILKKKIEFYPPGRNQKKLDLAVILSNKEKIMVEVKSYYKGHFKAKVFSYGDDEKTIRQNIEKAMDQLPTNSMNLIVFASQGIFNISDDLSGIIEALYGHPYISIPVGGKSQDIEDEFNYDGLFQPNKNTRISAIASFEQIIPFPGNRIEYIFKVYHNPYAKDKIDKSIFDTYQQFILEKDKMIWVNRDKSKG